MNNGAIEGIRRSAKRAETQAPGWKDRATEKLIEYVTTFRGTRFIAPDVRYWAERNGLDTPASNYAWGGVFRAAAAAGLIRAVGYMQYGDGVMHTQSVRLWEGA
jgi:hypothetical protein